jgi:hypothetical protein
MQRQSRAEARHRGRDKTHELGIELSQPRLADVVENKNSVDHGVSDVWGKNVTVSAKCGGLETFGCVQMLPNNPQTRKHRPRVTASAIIRFVSLNPRPIPLQPSFLGPFPSPRNGTHECLQSRPTSLAQCEEFFTTKLRLGSPIRRCAAESVSIPCNANYHP